MPGWRRAATGARLRWIPIKSVAEETLEALEKLGVRADDEHEDED